MWDRLGFDFGRRPISLAPRREFNGSQMWNRLGFDFGRRLISLALRREFNSICYGGQMWDRLGFDFGRRPISLARRREFNGTCCGGENSSGFNGTSRSDLHLTRELGFQGFDPKRGHYWRGI